MSCALFAAVLLLADSPPPGAEVRTDLYGDALPPKAIARLGMFRIMKGPVYSPYDPEDLTFSADGKRLITCSRDGQVRVWDATTGEFLRRQRMSWKPTQGREELEVVVLSPGGARMAAWDREKVYVFDALTGKERGRIPAEVEFDPPGLTFSPNGNHLFVQRLDMPGFFGSPIQQLWDLSRDAKHPHLTTLSRSSKFMLDRAAFTSDGKRLTGIEGGNLKLWDTATGKEIGNVGTHLKAASPLAYSQDGKTLAVASSSKTGVYLVDGATGKPRATLLPPADIRGCDLSAFAFSPDGRLLASTYDYQSGKDYGILLWDVLGRKVARRLSKPRCLGKLAFSPDGKTLANSSRANHEVCLWETLTGRTVNPPPGHDQWVRTLAVSPNGKRLLSGDFCRTLLLWDAGTAKPLHALRGADDWAHACLFTPDGRQIISAGVVGAFQVWDAASGKELRRFEIDWPDRGLVEMHAVGISADGKRLTAIASGGQRSHPAQILVWDIATGKLQRQHSYRLEVRSYGKPPIPWLFKAHAAIAPDGERMSVWLGEQVGIEEIATRCLLTTLPKGVGTPLVFSPDGRLVAAAILQPKIDPSDGDNMIGYALVEAATGGEVFRQNIDGFNFAAFAPDGRSVAVVDDKNLSVWDTSTGERLYQMAWPESIVGTRREPKIHSLAVLPDGRAATGMSEGDILIWDLAPATWPIHRPTGEPDRRKLDALWSNLAGDARTAYRAIQTMTAAPAQAVPYLNGRLQPVVVDTRRIEKLLADLDGEQYEAREAASRELAPLRDRAEPMLRRALEGKPSLEMRRRLQAILAEPKRPSTETLRTLRAIAALERIGTPEARRVLEKLSGGADARETRAASAALQRLNRLR